MHCDSSYEKLLILQVPRNLRSFILLEELPVQVAFFKAIFPDFDGSVTFQWNEPLKYKGIIRNYTLEIASLSLVSWQPTILIYGMRTNFTHRLLQLCSKFRATIAAHTSAGRGAPTSLEFYPCMLFRIILYLMLY